MAEVLALSELQSSYRGLLIITFLLSIVRLFKFLAFHERVAIISGTISLGAVELFHFGLVFLVSQCPLCFPPWLPC